MDEKNLKIYAGGHCCVSEVWLVLPAFLQINSESLAGCNHSVRVPVFLYCSSINFFLECLYPEVCYLHTSAPLIPEIGFEIVRQRSHFGCKVVAGYMNSGWQ